MDNIKEDRGKEERKWNKNEREVEKFINHEFL